MKLSTGTLTLAFATVIALALIQLEVEGSLTRPFQRVYEKTRNFRIRKFSDPRAQRRTRLNGFSAHAIPANNDDGMTARSGRSNNPTDISDFKSQCSGERGPSFKKAPKLFVYNSKMHAPETLGCDTNGAEQFTLEPRAGELGDSPKLDRDIIRRKLIDTGLFDPKAPTYFVIHGFLASWNSGNWMCDIKDLVLNTTRANVFIVDWSGGSKPVLPIDYSASVSNTQYVGAVLGEFINSLVQMTGQRDASRYHMIGHSLGAHICGYAGYYANTLGRITALDPAGPCFSSDSEEQQAVARRNGYLAGGKRRLSPQSASFVLALHTDTGLFGLNENCAHYDVYVNGGFKQPNCGASSIANRFEDLLELNLKDTFDVNIACAHSFAHQLVDTYVSFVGLENDASHFELPTNDLIVNDMAEGKTSGEMAFDRCFPMAYECADWESFKAGECGFCRDHETHCVFTGLSLFEYQTRKLADVDYAWGTADGSNDGDDDDQFNDEDNELGNDEHGIDSQKDEREHNKYSRGQHFMRSDDGLDSCLFQYQIVVAAKKGSIMAIQQEGKYYYYLHLPLELSGLLADAEGNRLHDRLVQVSHKLKPGSRPFEHLRSAYIDALREQNVDLTADTSDNLEFYTALITFKRPANEACANDPTNGAARKEHWQICKPLRNIREARLWSSSAQKLDAVVWVGLNYMSGVSYSMRMVNSWVLNRDPYEEIRAREQIERNDRAELNNLSPRKDNSLTNVIDKATDSANCLLSHLDIGNERNASRNFKCMRSGRELKFSVKLNPVRLGQA